MHRIWADALLVFATASVMHVVQHGHLGRVSLSFGKSEPVTGQGDTKASREDRDQLTESAPEIGPDIYFASHVSRKRSVHRDRLLYDASEHSFGIVADLDRDSRDPQKFLWRSYLKKGRLARDFVTGKFSVEWSETLELASKTANENRSMELSELVRFGRMLLAPCDITGLIWKIVPESGQVFQRFAVADGSGDFSKPAKMEWATVKDDALWVGSPGLEWITPEGKLLHRNAEWVKTIDSNGMITNYNWGPVYQALRTAAKATFPGYLWHEAVHWDPRTRKWIFLPRKRSVHDQYDPVSDAEKGTNLLIIADEHFQNISVSEIGPLDPLYGFTSVRKVPGTEDLYMALKVKEIERADVRQTHTVLTVFDLSGNFHTSPPFIEVGDLKFEGLEFLHD
jgi:soluble calcium-activated nucleotidase 1